MTRERGGRRLAAVLVSVWTTGGLVLASALATFAGADLSATELAGTAALLAAALLAEAYPVPLEGADGGRVSLAFVFGTAAVVLFGWAPGVVVLAAAPIVHVLARRPAVRITYNVGVFALAAGAGGLAGAAVAGSGSGALAARVAAVFAVQLAVSVILVSLAVSVTSARPLAEALSRTVRQLAFPAGLMMSAALMLVVLWEREPALAPALIGPLLAIALYQRSAHREMRALRLALTDPLTGLGNHRHFHERLQRELLAAEDTRAPLSLCVLDVDDFKRVNDRLGHPGGDRVLTDLAARLRHGGEAFRLGGDEFALLLPAHDESAATEIAAAVIERVRARPLADGLPVTVSAGVATVPPGATARDDVLRLADTALYAAKEQGKNQVRTSREAGVELVELRRFAATREGDVRYRAAVRLAAAVDARDAFDGAHSRRVGDLAARVARRLGVPAHEVELIRLAGSLHDLGKLAIPEEVLRKEGPLSDPERRLVERHPQTGFRMLANAGVDHVAAWVLHHHERWDGSGYPDGLEGEQIPLGARIVFAADAFDAMTSRRSYGGSVTVDEALVELRRCAGSQFDPRVVEAFAEELEAERELFTPALAS